MAAVKFYADTEAKISAHAVEEGAIYVASDSGKMYVDVGGERKEIGKAAAVSVDWDDIEGKPSNLATTADVSGAIAEEASERAKQDGLLEDSIAAKLGADDIIAGENVQVQNDAESGHVTISATDTKYTAGTGLGMISNGFYLLNGGVGLNQLANDSVSEDKLVDGAVDTAKIADAAVTADKIADGVIPTKLPNPNALTISLNGTSQGAYDGSAAKSVNVTAASVGAAAASHNHSAANITSGTLALDRIPTITDAKIQGMSATKLTGTIPQANLPSYVDDVLEYNGTSNFPETGETGKIYVDTSTNRTYRWGGTSYVEISASLALGTTSSTAFRGDYGNTAYQHATAKGAAFASGLYKITTNAQGHVTAATAVTKSDITALGIPASDTNTNTTYSLSKSGSTITLTGSDGTTTSVTDSNTTYTLSSFGITATAAELNYCDGVTSNIQTQLNNKLATTGTAAAATKLATARTISLTGNVTGSASFNGTANASIATTIANGSVTDAKLGSDVGTVAVQSATPTSDNVKLWIQI